MKKTLSLLFATLLSMLQMHAQVAQVPPPSYVAIPAGTQTLANQTIASTELWYKWVADTGVVKAKIKILSQGILLQAQYAEMYTVDNGTLTMTYRDSINADSTFNLYAGYVNYNSEVFIRILNSPSTCSTCTSNNPIINLTIQNVLLNCNPISPCDMVKNGGFENKSNFSAQCGFGLVNFNLIDCWLDLENTTDVYSGGCTSFANGFNLGTTTFLTPTAPLNTANPNPHNTAIGFIQEPLWNEAVQSLLITPLVQNRTYQLSFWAYNAAGFISVPYQPFDIINAVQHPINFAFGSSVGTIPSSSFFPNGQNLQKTVTLNAPLNTWAQYTTTFTATNSVAHSNLLMGMDFVNSAVNGYLSNGEKYYVLIDEVSIKEITPINPISSTTVCPNQLVNLYATGANSYTWQPGNYTNFGTATVSNSVTTTYTVTGSYAAGATCTAGPQYATVYIKPTPTISIIASTYTVCAGANTTVALSASGANQYIWSPCNTGCVGANFNVTPNVTTTYTVTGFSSVTGCTNTAVVTISVIATPTLVTAPFILSCLNASVTLVASGASTYTWITGPPSQTIATTNSVVVSPSVTTNYTVAGTSACGFQATQTATVAVFIPVITITATPNPLCVGQSATLQATGNNTFTWQPGNLTGATVVVTPTITTTYTVAGTNTICPGTTTAVVTVVVNSSTIPPFTITNAINNFNICANGTGTNVVGFGTNLTNTVGLTYLWDNGSTTPTPNYTITQPTIVSVTVSACATAQTQSVCVNYVAPACCNNTSVPLTNTVISTNITNATIKVAPNATITINGLVVLNNVRFLMGTSSAIVVAPNATLDLVTCKLYSCEGMWYGIKLLNTSTNAAKIIVRQTTIEDAYNAINADNLSGSVNVANSIDVILNSTLNKNYVDISIENTATYLGQYPLLVSSAIMQSQGTNTSPGTNLKCSGYYTPTIRDHSYAGLLATRAGNINFTYIANFRNLIKNKDYGLFFKRTDADVRNVDFKDMIAVQQLFPNNLPLGVGIVSQNAPKFLTVIPPTGSTPGIHTTFNNIGYGIIASKTPTVNVQYCDFNNPLQSTGLYGNYGIYAVDANSQLRMNYNTITRVLYGCTANFSVIPAPSTYSMSISNNTINAGNGQIKTAITINAATSPTLSLGAMVVAANNINKAEFGVFAINIHSGLRISGNTISLAIPTGTAFCEGVALGGCDGLMVDNNTIDGLLLPLGNANTYNVNSIGIGSGGSPNCFVQCNTITRVGTGVAYFGNNATGTGNTGKEFFGNTLNYPIKRGLALIANGIIGTQGNATSASANTWNGFPLNPQTDQTMVGVGGAISSALNSPLYLRNILNVERPTDNAFSLPSGTGDRYILGVSIFTLSPSAPNIATCTPSLSSGFRVMLTPTTSITQRNVDYSSYITSVLSATSNATPQQKLILKQHMHKNIRKTSVGTDATVAAFYATQQSSEVAKYYEVDSLLGDGSFTLAQTKNNSATASNNITQNHKTYNTIFLNGVATPSDYATLQALANKCAYEDGNAVYQARALLNMVNFTNTIYIDSCDGNNKAGRMGYFDEGEQQGITLTTNIYANLFPNPNSGEFMLSYDLKNVSEATVQIFDVRGSLLLNQTITNENNLTKIDATNFDNGIYFIKVIADNNTLWVSKFVINK